MKLQEAIESGKVFNRKAYLKEGACYIDIDLTDKCIPRFSLEDFLADDWEIDDGGEISISKSQLLKAIDDLGMNGNGSFSKELAYQLGFR